MTDHQLPYDWKTLDPMPPSPPVPRDDEPVHWDAICSKPLIDPTAWVAPGATVNGRVRLGARSSVWYSCILRGDQEYIDVGDECNIQDGSILHVDPARPCILERRVSLGHRALVHASHVKEGALIAIGATVLSRCIIGEGALIAAGALVLEDTVVPPHTLWAGVPARQIKPVDDKQRARIEHTWKHYVNNAAAHLARYGRAHIDQLIDG